LSSPYTATSSAGGRVQGPAIALMIVFALGIVGTLLSIVFNLLGMGGGMLGMGQEMPGGAAQLFSGVIGIVFNILGLGIYGFGIFAALKMKALESYTMAWVATIIGMLPCSVCCCLGIPIGIWSIVVLMNDDVKASFRG
jgi:hypothetical protein